MFEKNPAAAELWIALLLPRFPGQVLTALALNETKISPPMSDAAYWQPTANWDRSQWKLPFWNQPDSWLLLDRAVASEVLARPKLLSDGFIDKNLEWGSTRTIAALRVIENELGASERLSTAMRSIERRMNTLRSVEENR